MGYLSILLLLSFIFNNSVSCASADDHTLKQETRNKSIIQVVIKNEPSTITANKTETFHLQLLEGNKPLTSKDLKAVHTEKVHLIIIDSTLTDYHHVHPIIDNKNKDFIFSFTPKKSSSYRIWVDITPVATNKQVFLNTDIGFSSVKQLVDKQVKLNFNLNSYEFKLKLDEQPQVGKSVMATITVTREGKPFNQLEPVMGAFAHLVGFNADYFSILHIHPMGKEPSKNSERGGSQLVFHIEPQKAGFVKLFAQFQINGKDIYIPFGILVK